MKQHHLTSLFISGACALCAWGVWADEDDATALLQARLDAGRGKTVRIEKRAAPWVTRPLFLTNSNTHVVFADGVVIQAKKGAFRGLSDALLTIANGATNVTVEGEGKVLLEMHKQDYADRALYPFAEWRHTLVIGKSADVTVRNLELAHSGGDGVYIRDAAKNIRLEGLVCRDHYRQGISIISVDGLMVKNCRFTQTAGTAPQCGVDFEPNNTRNIFKNVLFEDCLFDENTSSGINLSLYLDATSQPVSIVFRRCRSIGNKGSGISIGTHGVRGSVLFEDCQVTASGNTPLVVRNLPKGTLDVLFNRCVFDDKDATRETVLLENATLAADGGGLTFDAVELRTNAKNPVQFIHLPGAGLCDVTGQLSIVNSARATRTFDLAKFAASFPRDPTALKVVERASCNLADLRPLKVGSKGPRTTPWLRGRVSIVCYADAPGRISFDVERKMVGSFLANRPLKATVFDAAGTEVLTRTLNSERETLSFDAPRPGAYRIAFGFVECKMRLSWKGVYAGLLADADLRVFKESGLDFRFAVPPAAKRVELFVNREEEADVVVEDADGKAQVKLDYARGGAPLRIVRNPSAAWEVWHVRLPRVCEDCAFRIGVDAQPLAFLADEDVLVGKDVPPCVTKGNFAICPPRIAPTPVEMTMNLDNLIPIRADQTLRLSVQAEGEEAKAWADAHLARWFVSPPKTVLVDFDGAAPESSEGYALEADATGLRISARTLQGLRYALFSLRQLAFPNRNTRTTQYHLIPEVHIRDWPRYAFRGIHICARPRTDLSAKELERQLVMAAYYKYNWAVIEPWYGSFASEKYPFLGNHDALLDRQEILRLRALAEEYGMRLIPQWNCFGHATLGSVTSGNHEILDEHPEYAPLFEPCGGWNWCLTNPETRKLHLGIAEEMLEMFGNPPYFHIGFDEAEPPSCPNCMRADYAKLVVDHIIYLHDELKKRGVKTMLWHDMLLAQDDPRWEGFKHNGFASLAREAERRLPRDLIVCEWYYGAPPKDGKFPTLDYFRKCGYSVLFCPWANQTCGLEMSDFGQTCGVQGLLQTIWLRYRGKYTPTIYTVGACAGWGTRPGDFLDSNAFRFKTHWRDVDRDLGITNRTETGICPRGTPYEP